MRIFNSLYILALIFSLLACSASSGDDPDSDGDGPGPDGDAEVLSDGDEERDESDEAGEPSILSLSIKSGNYQSGFYGEDLKAISVQVRGEDGQPLESVELEFSLMKATGLSTATDVTIATPIVFSDEEGRASTMVRLGELSGTAIIQVMDVAHRAVPVIFRLFSYHPADDAHRPLCILEINDFHMRMLPKAAANISLGGLARIAHIFKEIRKNNDEKGIATLIVNAGDDFENTMFHDIESSVSQLYEIYDAIGLDILLVGNHDYHFGIPMLDEQVQAASANFTGELQGHKLHFMWGNVDPSTLFEGYRDYIPLFESGFSDTENSSRYNQTVTLDLGGIKIGLLGVVTDAAIYTQVTGNPSLYNLIGAPTDYTEGMTFFNPDPRESDYISRGIDSLDEEGADIILVPSHAGLGYGDRVNIPPGKDEFIARYGIGENSGRTVDLVLSGHSHVALNHAIQVDNPNMGTSYLVQAKEAGEFVGAMIVEVDVEKNLFNLTDYHLLQVDAGVPEDEETAERVAEMKEQVIDKYGEAFDNVIGEIGVDLSSQQRSQSGLGQIVADSFLWKLKQEGVDCDVAFGVPSVYRADLWSGDITEKLAYDIVPMHNLDDVGFNLEPLVLVEMKPGIYDYSILGFENMSNEGVTAIKFALETIYSIEELDAIQPGTSSEFNFEVIQFAGMFYQVDYTAPPFQRVIESSIRIGGEPVDPGRSYRMAMVHSIGVNMAYILNFLIAAYDEESGEYQPPFKMFGEGEAALPYFDSGVLAWISLRDYIKERLDGTERIPDVAIVTGDRFRGRQPDLMVNPTDILWTVEKAKSGSVIDISVTVRNLGDVPVDSAEVELYFESTPWDLSDDDDGHLLDEGFDPSFTGSLVFIAAKSVSVGAHPANSTVDFSWEIPEDLPPYDYPLVVRIGSAKTSMIDPNRDKIYREVISGNNRGPDQSRRLTVY